MNNANCMPKNVEGINLSANSDVYTTNDKVFVPLLPVKVCDPNFIVFCEMYSSSVTAFCCKNVLRELGHFA